MYLLQRIFRLPLRYGILNQSSTSRVPRLITLSNTRTLIARNKSSKIEKLERKYKQKDKMPPTSTLIYNNPSAFWIEPLFHIQNLCIIICFFCIIYVVRLYLNNDIEFPFVYHNWIIARNEKEICYFIGITGFLLITSSLGCKFSTLRVYFDQAEKVYKVVLVSYLPFLKRVINIKPKSVVPVIRRFPIKDFRTFEFQVDGQKIFLYDQYFKRPADFHRMLKYHY